MTTIRIKLPKINEVSFFILAQESDQPIRGHAMVSGDDAVDKIYEDKIIHRLNNGDAWAWASVCVTASWKSLKGIAYLDGNCYEDEKDFIKNSIYYAEMKKEAYDDLISQITALK